VVIAAILGLIIGFYCGRCYCWILKRTSRRTLSAILTLLGVILPILLVLAYSYTSCRASAATSRRTRTRSRTGQRGRPAPALPQELERVGAAGRW
jgi:predicted PurR-regulated permease PerM